VQLFNLAFGILAGVGAERPDRKAARVVAEMDDRTVKRQAGACIDFRGELTTARRRTGSVGKA
jgi:hypothetical protein